MELKDRIIRNLEWSNKRLKLIGKGLDEEQIEIIEFSLLHDLLQLTLTDVVGQSEQCCEPLPKDSFYLGTTCPKCNKPFRNI